MSLKDQMERDLTVFLNPEEHGEVVTYKEAEIGAIVEWDEGPDETPDHRARLGTLLVKASDVAAPAYNDQVVVGSHNCKVIDVLPSPAGGLWNLRIEADARIRFRE